MEKNQKKSTLLPLITKVEQQELKKIKNAFFSKTVAIMDKNHNSKLIANILLELYPETNNLTEIYAQLSDLKKCLDSFRPFDVAQMLNLQEIFDTEYTYASNRIEGNTLTLRETSFIINEGLTIKNKSMKEHLEAINHKNAIEFIRELLDEKEPINEKNIKLIHSLILQGIDRTNAGIYRGVVVGISGTNIIFPEPYIVPKMMEDLIIFYNKNKDEFHPVKLAAQMHSKLVNIHPFIDGNGRTCRLLMNLILLQHNYPLTIFEPDVENRSIYFDALNKARNVENEEPFELFAAKNTKKWLCEYLKLVAPNNDKSKGYYFFKKIEPYLNK